MALAERPINLFDKKDIRDYNKHATLSALRAGCVRAVELDDSRGAKKDGSYLLSMAGVADAIYAELGIKPTKAAKGKNEKPVVVKESEEYKKLEELLTATQERSVEQEEELETLDKDVEEKATKIKELEEENKKSLAENKKLTTANKKLTKGAK